MQIISILLPKNSTVLQYVMYYCCLCYLKLVWNRSLCVCVLQGHIVLQLSNKVWYIRHNEKVKMHQIWRCQMECSKCSKWKRYGVKCLSVSEKLDFVIWWRHNSTQKPIPYSLLFSNDTINKPIPIFCLLSSGNITNPDTQNCLNCQSGGKRQESA